MPRDSEHAIRALAARLPKADLHLHLDGSLPESFIASQASSPGDPLPLPCPPASLRAHFLSQKAALQASSAYSQRPGGNWPAFAFCNRYLQTAPALSAAAHRVVLSHARNHVCWVVELRFCPSLHTNRGLSARDAVAAVVRGFAAAAAAVAPAPLRGGVVLCALRSYPPAHVALVARLASEWKHRGVVGMDLAGDEVSFPLELHEAQLQDAAQLVNLTVHAGENGPRRADNVRRAVDIGAARIGHALVLGEDVELCELVRKRGVYVETCLTANCSGGGKVPADRFDLHPVKEMLRRGVRVAGFSCDNTLLSGTLRNRPDPTEEIVRARIGCGLSWRQIRSVLVHGVKASFDDMNSPDDAQAFVKRFETTVDKLLEPVLEHDDDVVTALRC